MKQIEKIIENSFVELKSIACEYGTVERNQNRKQNREAKSKLIFPKKRDNSTRISEQEMRSSFIRELEALTGEDSYFYSIESPTKECYKDFSSKEPKIIKDQSENIEGRSGNIDLTLYNNELKREHLIEFKFGNKDTCKKDFLKLLCDDKQCKTNYYINILETFKDGTRKDVEKKYKDVEKKYKNAIKHVLDNYKNEIVSDLVIVVGVLYSEENESNFFIYKTINKNQIEIEREIEIKIEEKD